MNGMSISPVVLRRLSVTSLSTAISIHEPGIVAGFDPWPATDIQNTLAPPIVHRDARLEVFGQSKPKSQVGGDLVDLVRTGHDLTAWVADISGHGLRSAMLAGMVKTAMRFGLDLGQSLPQLLDRVNGILPGIKEPSMFATLAALRFDESPEVEYVSAGHLPLLHYRRRTGRVVRYSMDQFPLGLLDGEGYVSRRIHYDAGDIFVLVTDGIVEAGEDRDASSGLDRLEQILCDHSEFPLSEIFEAIQMDARFQGIQHDDQTVLLLRC